MNDRHETGLVLTVVALLATVLIGVAVWHFKHPCVRYAASTCDECDLPAWLPDGEGQPTIYVCWHYAKVPCQICAERAP